MTADLVANWQQYACIVSHTVPFDRVDEALATASTPGAADKIVVTFDRPLTQCRSESVAEAISGYRHSQADVVIGTSQQHDQSDHDPA